MEKVVSPPIESGDILFYTGSHSFFDRLISWWTKSSYVHVAIANDATYQIEARASGIIRSKIEPEHLGAVFSIRECVMQHDSDIDAALAPGVDKMIVLALVWLVGKIGCDYSWSDIGVAIAERYKRHFFFIQPQHYDCSALAAEFLVRVGFQLLMGDYDPAEITPGKLATFLNTSKGWHTL